MRASPGKFTTRAGIWLGRHGDRIADSGTDRPGGRPGGRTAGRAERGDGTAGGVALPLLAAALVCLLATSGVWLFANTGGDDSKNDTPIGLNVPTGGVNVPPNTAGSASITGPRASGSAAPSASATGPTAVSVSPSQAGVKSSAPPQSSNAPQPPQPPQPPPGQDPAPPSSPPSASAPPPAAPPPPEISPAGDATKSWGSVKLTVTVTYPPGALRKEWVLATPDNSWGCDDHGSRVADCDGRQGARGSGEAPREGQVQITFTIYGAGDSVSYTFNGAPYTVAVR